MIRKLLTVIFIFSISHSAQSQPATYTINKEWFSSDKYDEFAPVFYNNGLVFCSSRNAGIMNHSTSQNKGVSKIYFVDSTGRHVSARLFSKDLTSILNDGPVTFNKRRDTVYFSRNQDVSDKFSDIATRRNKLGIYSAVFINGEWTRVRELRINNEWYNVTTPCLSTDGKRLYFASDKPGGYGGSDLYYCPWNKDRWDDPVNLGPVINTKGNESYPFLTEDGLYFSSDGHPGLGGKDIFFSLYSDSSWSEPVHLDPPINSPFDDLGILTDPLMNEGFFSSNRDNTFDIYHFRTISPQVLYDIIQKENQYCFALSDSATLNIDTVKLKYVWNFGDGTKATGLKVKHCFPGDGKYTVRLDVIDRKTDKLFFNKLIYNLEIQNYKQAYINGPDMAVKGENVEFNGQSSNFPGYKISGYLWNFRDGTKAAGESVKHTFKKKGDYAVNMELVLRSNASGKIRKTGISRMIHVLDDSKERSSYLTKKNATLPLITESGGNSRIRIQYSADEELKKDVVFNIELLSTKTRIGTSNQVFKSVPKKYNVVEKHTPDDSTYSYIVDQQTSLMAAYPAFSELNNLGFRNVHVKTYVLRDPAEKDLNNLIKINGEFADSYFDNSDKLTSNALVMLDQIVKFMNKYPAVKLELAVHTDNSLPSDAALILTQRRSQLLINYIINRGISFKRLKPAGYGSSKPISLDDDEKDRRLNRRIEFSILSQGQ